MEKAKQQLRQSIRKKGKFDWEEAVFHTYLDVLVRIHIQDL